MNKSIDWGRVLLISIPFIWLLVLFLLPFLMVLKIALSEVATARPPYLPVFDASQGWQGLQTFWQQLDFENFYYLVEDDIYWLSYLASLKVATISTLLTLLVGYPIAYGLAKAPERWRPLLLMLVILPFWTSFLIRVYAWVGILKSEGLLNSALLQYFGQFTQQ